MESFFGARSPRPKATEVERDTARNFTLSRPSEVELNHASGTVVEVYQPGYRLGEHVIRPARVVVAA